MILVDKGGHLVSDCSVDELHFFADRIGLKRHWFQDKKFPHYDLKGVMMQRALVKGAVMVTSKELVARGVRRTVVNEG